MREGFDSYASAPLATRDDTLRWLSSYFVAQVCASQHLWDLEAWGSLATRAVALTREHGAFSFLPISLATLASTKLYAGQLHIAAVLIEESNAVATAARLAPIRGPELNLAAWRGEEAAATQMLEKFTTDASKRGEAYLLSMTGYATSVLYNGLGRYDLAQAGARRVRELDGFGFQDWALGELVEAAVRIGDIEEATTARDELQKRTRASNTDWALGLTARCNALLAHDAQQEECYQESVQRFATSHVAVHQARSLLLYGEWLRRQGRRRDARDKLRLAQEMCAAMGLNAFAERASRELSATGETVRHRVSSDMTLTSQESQIAVLASSGLTNPQIAARLSISRHTVEWHLRKVFRKLDIRSRRDLRIALEKPLGESPLGLH